MRARPAVSVVMAARNAESYIAEAIDSILNQTIDDFELLVVDDKSTDSTAAIVRSYKDPRVALFEGAGRGQGAALNIAIRSSSGPYVANLDSDDLAAPERLEKQARFLEAKPEFGLVGSAATVIDDTGEVLFVRDAVLENDTIQQLLLKKNCFVHSSIMVRRSVIDSVGGYRQFVGPSLDYDLVLRIAEVAKVANLSDRLCVYRENPTGLSYSEAGTTEQSATAARILADHRRRLGYEDLSVLHPDFTRARNEGRSVNVGWKPSTASRISLSRRYFAAGAAYIHMRRRSKARRAFAVALSAWPANGKAAIALAVTCLPLGASRIAGRLFRRTATLRQEVP
jgi:glycosyltransferase involved in cell wall biosynthesis